MTDDTTTHDTDPPADLPEGSETEHQDPGAANAAGVNGLTSEPVVEDSDETFPREYVQQLRDEAAKYRQRAGRADEAVQRLLETTVRSAAADHLADPGDLLAFGETDGLLDADGWPDADRIVDAAKTLAATKPHLAPRRPRGDIGQGATTPADTVNLAAMMRSRAT